MKTKKRVRRLLSLWLSLVMIVSNLAGLMPGMSLTALAWEGDPYASLVGITTKVTFNGVRWYIIEDNSTAVDAGTVTLLAADTSFGTMKFNANASSNSYNGSDVKDYLDSIVAGTVGVHNPEGGAVAGVRRTQPPVARSAQAEVQLRNASSLGVGQQTA